MVMMAEIVMYIYIYGTRQKPATVGKCLGTTQYIYILCVYMYLPSKLFCFYGFPQKNITNLTVFVHSLSTSILHCIVFLQNDAARQMVVRLDGNQVQDSPMPVTC